MIPSTGNQQVQNQQLNINPKLVEELKILQMSNIQLEHYIEEALIDNPLLEVEKTEDTIENYIVENGDYEYFNRDEAAYEDAANPDFTEYTSATSSLREYLSAQLGELELSSPCRTTAAYIIENIDTDGYLHSDVDEICNKLRIRKDRFLSVLKIIQDFEPAGVGARDLQECLIIQLKRKKLLTESIERVVTWHLGELAKRKYDEIALALNISCTQVVEIHRIIRMLDPKPGFEFCNTVETCYITPELIVKEEDDNFIVLFFDDKVPALKVSNYYKGLIRDKNSDRECREFVRSKLTRAIVIINAVERRRNTVINIAQAIVEYQSDFFRKGFSRMKPLTLKMISERTGYHESTVSRTVNGKYIQTPRGLFELKFFFSSGIDKSDGCKVSKNYIKDAIKKAISKEDFRNPLSDEGIAHLLKNDGINVARRTVSKYREELSILPAKLRR